MRAVLFWMMQHNCCPCILLARVLGGHQVVYRVADWEEACQGWKKWNP